MEAADHKSITSVIVESTLQVLPGAYILLT